MNIHFILNLWNDQCLGQCREPKCTMIFKQGEREREREKERGRKRCVLHKPMWRQTEVEWDSATMSDNEGVGLRERFSLRHRQCYYTFDLWSYLNLIQDYVWRPSVRDWWLWKVPEDDPLPQLLGGVLPYRATSWWTTSSRATHPTTVTSVAWKLRASLGIWCRSRDWLSVWGHVKKCRMNHTKMIDNWYIAKVASLHSLYIYVASPKLKGKWGCSLATKLVQDLYWSPFCQ